MPPLGTKTYIKVAYTFCNHSMLATETLWSLSVHKGCKVVNTDWAIRTLNVAMSLHKCMQTHIEHEFSAKP